MIEVTATDLQGKTGMIIDQALLAPVQVTRNKRAVVVLLSSQEYARLEAIEDAYWGETAKLAAQSGSVSQEEINQLLKRLA
jgi:PHD/YefM family antitoxin component YafN of YafNO toxin-antitoxin module